MRINPPFSSEASLSEETLSNHPVSCPLCSGVLTPLRDCLRCVRCSFSICTGCEPAECCSMPEAK